MNGTAFCFDLDGTLTTTEILPCIASEIGIAEEMAVLTKATMDGHIPFEPSFRLRCLILGRVPIERVHAIIRDIRLDLDILRFIHARNDDCFIVTGNLDIWIEPIVHRCGCGLFSSHAEWVQGELRVNSVLNKAHAVSALRSRGYRRIVAVGDGMNDRPMLEAADVAIAYGGVHMPAPMAIAASHFIAHSGESLCRILQAQ